ncbi:Bacteriocin-protection, YdeI or OmpD-Associated [Parapedobacter composti]|uniref:Bacteriocin-protection, YdeI or OmpD-Associated n=1 Tax=Parapedobacter composti TaxID=623281 RepID=A0A1I1JK45_9SPHI|nr:YdeI/OmpD-associated family protein [Parapedobacter composti]SFC48989.1 Bacteriocin-protection, YdeI or OmpD-Associated [Parapedobacter composti]
MIVQSETPGAAMVGWAFIEVPRSIAGQLKPGYRQVYRVRGDIDGHPFSGLTLMPKGEGNYFLAINGQMRKVLRKSVGDTLSLRLEEDTDFVIEVPEDLEICLRDGEEGLWERFMELPKSHRNYFLNYIRDAKTITTRAKRIAMTVEAMASGLDFGAMIRLNKARRQNP